MGTWGSGLYPGAQGFLLALCIGVIPRVSHENICCPGGHMQLTTCKASASPSVLSLQLVII